MKSLVTYLPSSTFQYKLNGLSQLSSADVIAPELPKYSFKIDRKSFNKSLFLMFKKVIFDDAIAANKDLTDDNSTLIPLLAA